MANGWGGKRKGAGRKPGAATRKTREIAEKAAAESLTPLEAMLTIMKERQEAGDWQGVLEAARSAAPYMHPRLQSVETRHSGSLSYTPRQLSTSELRTALGLDQMSEEQRLELSLALGLSDGSSAQLQSGERPH
jgi:hypothetical protein